MGGAAYHHQGPPLKRQPLPPWGPLGVQTKLLHQHPQGRAVDEGEGPQEEPGTFEMGGAPWEHDIRWVSRKGGIQSQALAAEGCCLAAEGREERVEVGGRGGLGPGTGQKTSRSRSPRFQGCICWGTCFGYPGLYPSGHCSRHH